MEIGQTRPANPGGDKFVDTLTRAINRISVSNFRSFDEFDIELGRLNVLVGANASGKSNFIQLLRFLRDTINHGLRDAISYQAGVEYLKNAKIGKSRVFHLKVSSDKPFDWNLIRGRGARLATARVRVTHMTYEFAIEFKKTRGAYRITYEKLNLKFEFQEEEVPASGEVSISVDNGKLKYTITPPELDQAYRILLRTSEMPATSLLIESQVFFPPFPRSRTPFGDLSIYDFDPKQTKKAVPFAGTTQLAEDGSNLALVLSNIIQTKEKRRKFSNLIQDLLPFVDQVSVQRFADRSLIFSLRETYAPRFSLPAPFVSDGTINIVSLIVPLYFEDNPLVVIEEPERNIHPFLISKLVAMLKDASKNKQIIVSTHNPEIIKHVGIENLILVSRNKEGFSTVSKPQDSEQVKIFLKNDMGIEELFVQNLIR